MKISLLTTGPNVEEITRIGEEIKKLGHEFEVVDFINFSFRVKNNNLTIFQLQNFNPDLVIVRQMFSSINSVTPIVDYLRSKNIKIFDNGVFTHKYSINKVSDIVKLSIANLPTPDTAYSKESQDLLNLAEAIGYPIVVKSAKMGKGASVEKVNTREELAIYIKNFEESKLQSKTILVQEFIPYKFDLRVFVLGDKTFTMRRIPPEGDFRANFSLGGSVEPFDLSEKHKKLAIKAARAIDLDVAGVDLLVKDNDEALVLEVNHTPGMLGIEKATGENITKMYVEYAIKQAS